MGKYENEMMDNMVSSDQPLVPRVDKHVGKKRWGVDTPMFESKSDMHSFLQGVGMAPGGFPADFLDSALYMSEGEFWNGIISLSAAVPVLGGLATSGRKMAGRVINNKYVSSDKLEKFEKIKASMGERLSVDRMNIDKELAAKTLESQEKTAERLWGIIDKKMAHSARGTKMISEMEPKMAAYESAHKAGMKRNKLLSEFRDGAYKAEEYIQKSDYPLEPFIKQANVGRAGGPIHQSVEVMALAKDMRANWLLQEALEKGIITNRQADMYRGSAFKQIGNYTQSELVAGKIPSTKIINEIKKDVSERLTTKGVSEYGAAAFQKSIDESMKLPENIKAFTKEKMGTPKSKGAVSKVMDYFKDMF